MHFCTPRLPSGNTLVFVKSALVRAIGWRDLVGLSRLWREPSIARRATEGRFEHLSAFGGFENSDFEFVSSFGFRILDLKREVCYGSGYKNKSEDSAMVG
jgi:hypothetical protein